MAANWKRTSCLLGERSLQAAGASPKGSRSAVYGQLRGAVTATCLGDLAVS